MDANGKEFIICTRSIFEARGWETCISHHAYGRGVTIQVGVAVTYDRAAQMHAHWIQLLHTDLPKTITEVGIGGDGYYTGEVIFVKDNHLYPTTTDLLCEFCRRGLISNYDTWQSYKGRWYHEDCLKYYLATKED